MAVLQTAIVLDFRFIYLFVVAAPFHVHLGCVLSGIDRPSPEMLLQRLVRYWKDWEKVLPQGL